VKKGVAGVRRRNPRLAEFLFPNRRNILKRSIIICVRSGKRYVFDYEYFKSFFIEGGNEEVNDK
jgi:hypothetical protein